MFAFGMLAGAVRATDINFIFQGDVVFTNNTATTGGQKLHTDGSEYCAVLGGNPLKPNAGLYRGFTVSTMHGPIFAIFGSQLHGNAFAF